MGKSLIYIQNKSLWFHDYHLEPIIFFVIKALSEKIEKFEIESDHIEWFKDYNVELQNLFMGVSDGALDFEFDKLNQNIYRISLIKSILMTLFSIFNSIDVNISKKQFDKIDDFFFGNYANWEEPINSKNLAEKINELISFIS